MEIVEFWCQRRELETRRWVKTQRWKLERPEGRDLTARLRDERNAFWVGNWARRLKSSEYLCKILTGHGRASGLRPSGPPSFVRVDFLQESIFQSRSSTLFSRPRSCRSVRCSSLSPRSRRLRILIFSSFFLKARIPRISNFPVSSADPEVPDLQRSSNLFSMCISLRPQGLFVCFPEMPEMSFSHFHFILSFSSSLSTQFSLLFSRFLKCCLQLQKLELHSFCSSSTSLPLLEVSEVSQFSLSYCIYALLFLGCIRLTHLVLL